MFDVISFALLSVSLTVLAYLLSAGAAGYCAFGGTSTAFTCTVPPEAPMFVAQSEYPVFLTEISCFPDATVTFKGVLPTSAPST